MATNNAVNINASGIVSYDGAGTFTALAIPLTVANGGTGDSSLTAYAVLCGGTTSTNPIQALSSLGSTGTILTSNGAGALPSFQGGAGGYVLRINSSGDSGTLADGQTYFIRAFNSLTTSTSSGNIFQTIYIPRTGTIIGCFGFLTLTAGSNEGTTIAIRLNNSSDTTVTSSLDLSSATASFSNSSLGIAVTAGDYIEVKLVGPTWSSNPTSVRISVTVNLI